MVDPEKYKEFTDEMAKAIRHKELEDVPEDYRNGMATGLLMASLDDIDPYLANVAETVRRTYRVHQAAANVASLLAEGHSDEGGDQDDGLSEWLDDAKEAAEDGLGELHRDDADEAAEAYFRMGMSYAFDTVSYRLTGEDDSSAEVVVDELVSRHKRARSIVSALARAFGGGHD